MTEPGDIRAHFIRMVQQPEPAIDLARTALLVAAESDPNVDVDGELHTLESWAAELRARLEPGWNNLQKLARLRAYVFEELGFRGDRLDYFNPSNSLLHEVLHRRRGIPLTLAIVMMELGWRIGIPFEGVGFPGHFLVRLAGEPLDLLLDPYRRGMSVHEEDCRRILLETTGGKLEFEHSQLASVGKREMIGRLLHNLKGAYLRKDEDEAALAAVERLLVLDPENADETRDRGLLLFRLHRYGQALDSLNRYLERAPAAHDRETVERHVRALRQLLANLN
ncbi:MAG TPA: tetratricopeptide repeat protein [Candidatus Eisenbacteria bacterium]